MATRILQIVYYPALLEVRRILLEQAGYDVTSASNNEQGMSLASADSFDLIVVGFSADFTVRNELIQWLKQHVPHTPVVALLACDAEHFPDADYEISENPQFWLHGIAGCIESKKSCTGKPEAIPIQAKAG